MQVLVALVAGLGSVALGLLVVLRGHQMRIGALLIGHGITLGVFLGLPSGAGTSRAGLVADQLTQGIWVLLFLWLPLIAYLLPDGRPASPRWGRWIGVGLTGYLLFAVGAAGDRGQFAATHGSTAPPLAWLPEPLSGLVGLVGLALVAVFVLGSFVCLVLRVRGAAGDRRLRLLWPLWGSLFVPCVLVFGWANYFLLGDHELPFFLALSILGVALPATMTVSVLRHRLFDIELVLSRTLIYGLLSLVVIGAYAGLLTLTDRVLGDRSVGGLIAVGVVAVLIHPTYAWVRRRVERLVYGYRSEPAVALRRLGASAESADPMRVVESITASVAEALKVRDVWFEPASGEGALRPRAERAMRTPLIHRGETLGHLAVVVPPDRSWSPADDALLRDLSRHAAVTVMAAQQAVELQESRSRIVSAREEERKRLRRDLHDGVGPSLAAIVLKLNAVQSRSSRPARDTLLTEIQAEVQETIREIRRLVDDLRPPALDEVGLVGAIRQRARAMSTEALRYDLLGDETLPELPAAVEVAAFRIASEAMANVAKHSGATRCTVEIELDDALDVRITDNGRDGAKPGRPGVGLISMQERAAELGGVCSVAGRPEGGIVVRAVLPVALALPRPGKVTA